MDLVILGSGKSSKIKTQGLTIYKHWVKLNGEYLIERIIRIAYECGINKVHCIINSNEPELKNFLLTKTFHIPINLLIDDTQGSTQSLSSSTHFLSNEPLCLITSDAAFSIVEFLRFINYSKMQEDVDGILAITKYINDEKPLCVAMDEEDTIFKFSDIKDGYGWAAGGVYYFSPEILKDMNNMLISGLFEIKNFLRYLLTQGYILKGFSFPKIINIDTT